MTIIKITWEKDINWVEQLTKEFAMLASDAEGICRTEELAENIIKTGVGQSLIDALQDAANKWNAEADKV